ncbi:hypothetical protein KAR10_01600 [bacterium]|nr:hypothetical protein [bacterium]
MPTAPVKLILRIREMFRVIFGSAGIKRKLKEQNQRLQHTNRKLAAELREQNKLMGEMEARIAERSQELEKALDQMKNLDALKSDFLSITSHELRTPLTIIRGALNLLQNEGDKLPPARFKKYLDMAEKNTGRLIQLINDLLDFSRVESGHLRLKISRVDMVRIIRESVEEFRELGDQRDLKIMKELAPNLPGLMGDRGRVKQVLNNLISNALKFTPVGGKITVNLRQDGIFLEIVVTDTGIGISRQDQEKIFNKFYQSNGSITRETTGVGLGLAIVKELVRLHKGRIWVESQVGQGSRFYVRLPLDGPRDLESDADYNHNDNLEDVQNQPLVLDS